jgi:hypothetical protein
MFSCPCLCEPGLLQRSFKDRLRVIGRRDDQPGSEIADKGSAKPKVPQAWEWREGSQASVCFPPRIVHNTLGLWPGVLRERFQKSWGIKIHDIHQKRCECLCCCDGLQGLELLVAESPCGAAGAVPCGILTVSILGTTTPRFQWVCERLPMHILYLNSQCITPKKHLKVRANEKVPRLWFF